MVTSSCLSLAYAHINQISSGDDVDGDDDDDDDEDCDDTIMLTRKSWQQLGHDFNTDLPAVLASDLPACWLRCQQLLMMMTMTRLI